MASVGALRNSSMKHVNEVFLRTLNAEESKFLSAGFARHRKASWSCKNRCYIDATLTRQFAQQNESAPPDAVPLLIVLANDPKAIDTDRAQAFKVLTNSR